MTTKPNIEVSEPHWLLVQAILQEHLAEFEVWAFGSRAKHTAKPYSDLDLLLIAEKPLALNRLALVNEAFEESDLPWKVDVLDGSRISEEFSRMIGPDCVLIQRPKKANRRQK